MRTVMVQNSKRRSRLDREKWREQSLSQFVEKVFLRLEAAAATHEYRSQCRRVVKLFGEFLGRRAVMSDLTPGAATRFVEWLPGHVPDSQLRILKKRLRSVWRYAAVIGFADEIDEYERPKGEPKPKPVKEPRVLTPGTLSHFFETVYLPLRMVGARKDSIKDYRNKIEQFNQYIGRPVMLSELTDALLAGYLNHRVELGLRKATVNGDRSAINCVWRFAAEEGLTATQPRIRKLREENDEPDAWTEEEFRLMLCKCEGLESRRKFSGLSAGDLMRAVLLVAYWTGLRRGTLWKLKWCDVDLENRWVSVPGSMMKGRRGKKFRFGEDAAEALAAIQVDGAETVFPPVDWSGDGSFYRCFDALLIAAGVPPSKRRVMSKLHKVRRTTATMVAVRQGLGAASSLLGHSSEQITLRYIDPSKLHGNDVTNVLPSLSTKKDGAA